MKLQAYLSFLAFFSLLLLPFLVVADCECGSNSKAPDRAKALRLKLITIASVLVAGAVGVCLPLLGKSIAALQSDKDVFFVIKAFAAGVILATGMLHILPDAFGSLTSPCLKQNPWGNFPFAGFIAMLSAIGTLIVDTVAMGYYKRHHFGKRQAVVNGEEELGEEHSGHVHVHTHATHGHAHASGDSASVDLIRHRVVSQVPEFEISNDEMSG